MSDYEFDMRMKELEALEQEFPDLASPDSPTLKVGSDLSGTGTIFPDFPGTNANAGCAKGSKLEAMPKRSSPNQQDKNPPNQEVRPKNLNNIPINIRCCPLATHTT